MICHVVPVSLPCPWEGEGALRWRHNGRDSVSNHQPHDCFLNRLFTRRSKKTSKLRVTGLCAGNPPGTGEFPAQIASNAENVSIWWRHHDITVSGMVVYTILVIYGFIWCIIPIWFPNAYTMPDCAFLTKSGLNYIEMAAIGRDISRCAFLREISLKRVPNLDSPITDGFPSENTSNAELWSFLAAWSKQSKQSRLYFAGDKYWSSHG